MNIHDEDTALCLYVFNVYKVVQESKLLIGNQYFMTEAYFTTGTGNKRSHFVFDLPLFFDAERSHFVVINVQTLQVPPCYNAQLISKELNHNSDIIYSHRSSNFSLDFDH